MEAQRPAVEPDSEPGGEPRAAYYQDVVRLPGFDAPPDRCRPLKPVGFCDHGHVVLGRSSCETRRCPEHWRDWLESAVIALVARLAAYRYVQEGAGRRLVHASVSPPQDRRWTTEALWEARSAAYEAAEAAGIRGGTAITHPYRTSDLANTLYEAATEHGDLPEDYGRWKFLRDTASDWDEMKRYTEPAPHFHVLGAAVDVDGEAVPDGWIVTRHRSLGRFHLRDVEAYRDMVSAAYYILTHAGVQDGRQTTTYFGEVHPAAFDPSEELTTAEWERIQINAERAVKTKPGEGVMSQADDRRECPRDDCEAVVIDLMDLREYLSNEDWVAALRTRKGGNTRWLQLRGLQVWIFEGGDRPPPGARRSEPRMLEWLEDTGRTHTVSPRRTSLGHWTASQASSSSGGSSR